MTRLLTCSEGARQTISFKAKFHRVPASFNRSNTMAIADAVSRKAAWETELKQTCSFCDLAKDQNETCYSGYGREMASPVRVCGHCNKMSPVAELDCCHCAATFGNDLLGKFPVIVLLFIAAFVPAVALEAAR